MKTLTRLLLILGLLAFPAKAQNTPSQSSTGNITASGTTCLTTNACVQMILPNNATTVAVVLGGTFSAEVTLEQSADNGNSWAQVAILSAAGTTSYTVTAMTNFRVRCDGYTSGTINVTLNESSGGTGGVGSGNVTGTGTANNGACWSGTSIITNCADFTDAGGAPTFTAPLTVAGGAGVAGAIDFPEGAPATCPLPTLGHQIVCSINSPNSFVLSNNGAAYAAFGAGGGGVTSLNSLTGGLSIVAGSNVTVTPSGSSITIASTGGGGSSTWATLPLSGTNTGTGLLFAPTATGTVPFTLDCPTGMTVDCFDIKINHVFAGGWDGSGNFKFAGTNLNVGSSTSSTAGLVAVHGGNTSSLPGCFQLFNNADAVNASLCASNTNGRIMMQSGLGAGEFVQSFLLKDPIVNAQTGTSYAILASDFGNLITLKNASAIAVTIPQAGTAGTEAGFGTGWYTDVCVQRQSVGSATITPTTSTINDGASNLVLAPGSCARILSNGTNYEATPYNVGGGTTGAAGGDLAGTYPNPTIATTGSSAASCGDATHTCTLTINTKGQVTANSNVPVGLGGRSVTGAATTDTVVSGDNATVIDHDQAASGTVNQTLPTATTLGNASFVYSYSNHSAQTDTITPTTWTIQKGSTAAGSSISVPAGAFVRITVDPNSSTNWLADCAACGTTGLSGMTAGQVPLAATASTITSSKALVGTDTGIPTAGTIASAVGKPVVADANGGVTTVGGPPDLTAAGSVWYPFGIWSPVTSTGTGVLGGGGSGNDPVMYLINIPVPVKITTVTFGVSTGVAASTGDIGMYSISGTTATLAWHTGSFASATSANVQSITLGTPVTLSPGQYYLATCDTTASVLTYSVTSSAFPTILGAAGTLAHSWGFNVTDLCTAGVLPGTQTTTNIANNIGATPLGVVVKIIN